MEYNYQTTADDLRIQYTIVTPDEKTEEIGEQLFLEELSNVYSEIDRLTNHADGYDYALAVSSGLLAGMIDIIIVGEWDFARGKASANEAVNKRIINFAKKQPDYIEYCNYTKEGQRIKPKDPNRLRTVIEYLEWKFPLPGDAPWLETGYDIDGNVVESKKISPKSHHLDDLSHHPTIVGLIACIISQFTNVGTYVNKDNQIIRIPFSVDEAGLIEGKTPVANVGAGIINWCFNVAKNWHGHLMSDMGGTKTAPGEGMGIPGSVLSTLKELALLPCFSDPDFSKKLSDAFIKGIGTGKGQIDLGLINCLFEGADSKVDFRTEYAVKKELSRQALPVAINEVVVRAFYFIRHFTLEMKEKGSIECIDLKKIVPINNRTIVRMMTISTGTMTAIDLADATIQGIIQSKGNPIEFGRAFILRINFVGLGRFTMAVGADLFMGARKGRLELAAACGEVAVTALDVRNATNTTKKINEETERRIINMGNVSKEIEGLKI